MSSTFGWIHGSRNRSLNLLYAIAKAGVNSNKVTKILGVIISCNYDVSTVTKMVSKHYQQKLHYFNASFQKSS